MYLTRLRGLRGFCAGFAKDSRSTCTGRGSTGIKAEAMVGAGLSTSKINTWKKPENKEIKGFPMFDKDDLAF